MKITAFDVFKKMSAEDNQKLMMVPLKYFIRGQKTKRGCELTFGAPEECLMGFVTGAYCGGIILCDATEFHRIEAELKKAAEVPSQ